RTRKGSGEGEGALLSSAPVSKPGRQAAFPRWPTSQIFIFSGCSRAQNLDGYLLAFEIPNWTRTLTCRKSVANAVQEHKGGMVSEMSNLTRLRESAEDSSRNRTEA